jgi:hypothetical protein
MFLFNMRYKSSSCLIFCIGFRLFRLLFDFECGRDARAPFILKRKMNHNGSKEDMDEHKIKSFRQINADEH